MLINVRALKYLDHCLKTERMTFCRRSMAPGSCLRLFVGLENMAFGFGVASVAVPQFSVPTDLFRCFLYPNFPTLSGPARGGHRPNRHQRASRAAEGVPGDAEGGGGSRAAGPRGAVRADEARGFAAGGGARRDLEVR